MNLSIRMKVAGVLVIGLLCFAAIGYGLYTDAPLRAIILYGPQTQDDAILQPLNNLRASLKDIETSEMGYALSGDGSYLSNHAAASAALYQSIGDVRKLIANDQKAQQDLRLVEQLVAQRLQFSQKIMASRSSTGRKAADTLVRSSTGRQLSARIGTSLSSLERDGRSAHVHQSTALAKSFRHGIILVTAGFGLTLVIFLASFFLIGRDLSRNRRSGKTLRELREKYRIFAEGIKDSAQIMLGPDGRILNWNDSAERLLGYHTEQIRGRHFSALFLEEDVLLGRPERSLKTAEADGHDELNGSCKRMDGSLFQAHIVITLLRDRVGELKGFSVVTRDVTAQKQTEEQLNKLSQTVDQASDLVMITDRTGAVVYVNSAVEEVTGYTRDELFAGAWDILQNKERNPVLYQQIWDTVLSGRSFRTEITTLVKNEEEIFIDAVITPSKDSRGTITHAVFTGTDITPLKLMRNKLDYLSSYDSVTGLPNRDLFTGKLGRHVSVGGSDREAIAVLAIDIDRFKYINEIYGLEVGNKVLKQVAESLSVSVSKGDTVGRLGSDEFGIVLYDIKRPADVVLFVKMIMKNVPQIVMSGGEEIAVTLATGIAMYPTDGKDALTLMKNADTALSKAKGLGRNRFQFYTADMNVGISEIVFMERRLSDALKNKEYILTFQPYCHLSTRKLAGSEALLKWNNDEFGLVSPSKFIPMLEETGMIIDVGRWVLRTACLQIKEWTNGHSLPVSVNLSPSQFRHEYLVETVESTIRETGIDPRLLTLEVTESTFMQDQDFAVKVLKRLKALGVSIAIDDGGTGYSSLSYLKRFPVDFVKIDQSFVQDVATDPDTMSLVTAIIAISHSLGLKTVAEGVETEAQWNILRLLKCDIGQGYYFSPAVSAKECEKLMV